MFRRPYVHLQCGEVQRGLRFSLHRRCNCAPRSASHPPARSTCGGYLRSLEQLRARQLQEREAAGTGWQHSGYLFTRPDGAPIEGSTLTRHFNTLLHRAGLRRIRFHDLRHSAATLLLEQGVELVVIKELLGHAHIGVTATVYAHIRLRRQHDVINTLSTALSNPETTETANGDGDEPLPCAAFVR
ncbi:tyrosine-type recombinase/integrase [Streptomyces sp. NPDC088350]|uniref:tyrosine-type recombinase/integrase n=1 Tax=Streptomyces sp. NPDC088350 TaxID=3365854 RepID=UPI0037FAF589